MKMSKLALLAAICCGASASADQGQQAYYQPSALAGSGIRQVSSCDCGEPVCGCEAVVAPSACGCTSGCAQPSCDNMPACGTIGCDGGCDGGCDSFSSGCDCGGGCPLGGCLSGDCDLGDPFTLFGEVGNLSMGGWVQMGYHSKALSLFNSRPDEYQLHQAWLYAEKSIDTSNGFDIGGRIDYVYGTDGPDTQAFGMNNNHWDAGWTNGNDYGHALPQVYFEAGYGDLSVKVGHFYTTIGWEVVTAPDNFFYSHAYTMYNSEPFTHSGALATYALDEDISVFGGYVFGWDSGFDDNGDAFLGGISASLSDDVSLTYSATGGRFADNQATVEKGYMHSIVADIALSDNLQYIFQSDLLDTEDGSNAGVRKTFGLNNYLIYTLSDCLAAGGRFEWYQNEGVYSNYGQEADIYALTLGLNYKPHANVIVRPEIRFDWNDDNAVALNVLENNDDDQTTFGIDTIFLF